MAAAAPDQFSGESPVSPAGLMGVRIYAQLKPDAAGLAELVRLQTAARVLAPRARPVSPDRLHLTLIHFGKADEAYARLNAATGVSQELFSRALGTYLAATEAALPARDFVLSPVGLAGFGQAGTTLVVEYRPTRELDELHAVLYGLLLEFLRSCESPDPEAYAARDPALAFSAALRPHVSILHGFRPPAGAGLPPVAAVPLRLTPLPVLYRT
ncbi:hypothetical protein ITX31_15370 [Arthrobacter gandavensis]|uniref:hypothetical protein n=1 Tax=Arthrobacter gandavensis TaxID=169960 RepID=UPI00188EFD08|nr:hypothetical protein [Arthrobacter gandavensis]MBF4995476.1 hypothetical protein [Arthrobacter gandavensis]